MKNAKLLGTIITGILSLIGVVVIGLAAATSSMEGEFLTTVGSLGLPELLVFVVTLIYLVSDYKIPHGNSMRFLILLFSVSIIPSMYNHAQSGAGIPVVLSGVAIALSAYMSGRLSRIKKNIAVIIIVSVLLAGRLAIDLTAMAGAASAALGATPFSLGIRAAGHLIAWLAICTAYLTRFSEHTEAGLEVPKQ